MIATARPPDPHRHLVADALAALRQDRATGADYRPADLDVMAAWRACADALPHTADAARAALAAFLADHWTTLAELIERARWGCGPTPFLDEVARILDAHA